MRGTEDVDNKFSDGDEDQQFDDDGKPKRTGTIWSASAHIITSIIGSGVLSLAWGTAQLGWIGGLMTLITFSCIAFYTSNLLADCYRSPDPVTGKRNHSYMEEVRANLGRINSIACGILQYANLSGMVIGYTITASISMVAVHKSNCFHRKGHSASCKFSNNPYMIGLGVFEIFLSQIPNLHNLTILSAIAAVMSFGYSSIGIGLALATIISGKGGKTTLTGVEVGVDVTVADKVWRACRALGDIAFTYSFSAVLVEIQDTLKSEPPENQAMKKANGISLFTVTAFYMMCGILGYAAFGNVAPGNMLTGFGFYEPFWLVDVANIFIVVHLVGAYQVFTQPVYLFYETWAREKWPNSTFVNKEYPIKIGNKIVLNFNLLRLTGRTIFVVLATILAMAMPFFNDFLALLGAIGFWPLTVYFPVQMHIAQRKIKRTSLKWCILQLINFFCLLVSLAAAAGSIQGVGETLRTIWSASAHIITSIIGSGVLSLAWGTAQLGWIGGLMTLITFSCIAFYTSNLLADCYRSPDPVTGKRNHSYMEEVRANLGRINSIACGILQYANLSGMVIGYTITASISMVAVHKSNCFHRKGHSASCKFSNNPYMIGLGVFEIFLSQIPNLHNLTILSAIAAVMSFGYSSIGIGLALATIISGKGGKTTLTGVEVGVDVTVADKVWRACRALGDIAFTYSFSAVLVEIQDTLKSEPPENQAMKKANGISLFTVTAFYMMCGILGYAAFGNVAPGNMLTGFGFYEPFWLVDVANIFIVVHLVGAYQVFTQPVYLFYETWAREKWPNSTFVNKEYPIKIGNKIVLNFNLLRLTGRTIFVVLATILAMAMPFFNDFLALLGAIGFWPLTVYFPVQMHIAQRKIKRTSLKWCILQLINFFCLLVSLAAAAGSIQGVGETLSTSKPFQYKV